MSELLAPPQAEDWRRLDPRMLLIHPVVEVGKALPAILGALLAGHSAGNDTSGSRWSLGIAALVVVFALTRWFTTRYRISAGQIQLRHGLIRRRAKAAPLDRVRTVDVTSHLMHRMLGLARVVIGTGTSDRKGRDAIVLDGLTAAAAAALRVELLHRSTSVAQTPAHDRSDAYVAQSEREIARLQPAWLRYAPFTLTGAVTGLALLGIVWRIVSEGHVDLHKLKPYRQVADQLTRWPLGLDLVVVFAALSAFVALASTVGYVLSFWNFRLTQHSGGTLHISRGLITSRATSIEHRRLRGAEVSEPLLLRAAGGARTLVIATGLRVGRGAERGGEILLPPAPVAEAVRVAATVIDTAAPFAVPLRAHARAALRRRVLRSVGSFVLAGAVFAGAIALFGWPRWLWWLPVLALATAVPLGRDRYRSLGHAFADGYLVTRFGSLVRRRCAVAVDGVIGWNFTSTFMQRRLELVTLTATTAAGKQKYPVEDVGTAEAVRLGLIATPGLLDEFIE